MVCGGAMMMCSFGVAPMPLQVLPQNGVVGQMPFANIMDNKPMVNIPPFVMCNSKSNPAVIAATAAAMGAPTPAPCTPLMPAPWSPGSPTVTIKGQPALTDASTAVCAWGGAISFHFAGQATVTAP